MGRKSTVGKLEDAQFDFLIRAILDGKTDREIEALFEEEFETALPKSSLNSWRNKAGNELADRYRLKRFQVRTFVEQLRGEGFDLGEDKYKNIIENLEDHLLTAERELVAQNPMKLLSARQEEERLRIKREELELKKEAIALEREKLRGAAVDHVKLGVQFLGDLYDYLVDDPEGILFVKKHAKGFNEFVKGKYAAGQEG